MPELGTIILPQFNHPTASWRIRERRGRVFDVEGMTLELFAIRVLSSAIGRSPGTIKTWERAKQFPKPMFVVPVSPGQSSRWYSKTQIANIRALYQKMKPRERGPTGDLERFLKEVWTIFYLLEPTEDALRGDVL